jgi:hypothetical protein
MACGLELCSRMPMSPFDVYICHQHRAAELETLDAARSVTTLLTKRRMPPCCSACAGACLRRFFALFERKAFSFFLGGSVCAPFFFPLRGERLQRLDFGIFTRCILCQVCAAVCWCVCNDLCVWRDRQRYAQMSNQRDSHTRRLLVCMRCAACVRAAHTRARAHTHTHTHTQTHQATSVRGLKLLVYEA